MKTKNVLIPLDLLREIAELLYCLNAALCDSPRDCRYSPVMKAIMNKLISVGLHNVYSRTVAEAGPTAAKDGYLKLKRRYDSLRL